MKLPNLSSPVTNSKNTSTTNVLSPSSCGCKNVCIGACVFGTCTGFCA